MKNTLTKLLASIFALSTLAPSATNCLQLVRLATRGKGNKDGPTVLLVKRHKDPPDGGVPSARGGLDNSWEKVQGSIPHHLRPPKSYPHIRDMTTAPEPNSVVVVDPTELKKDGIGPFIMFKGTRLRIEREPEGHHANVYKILDPKHQEGKPLAHYTDVRPEIGEVIVVEPQRVYWKDREMYAKFKLPVKKYKNALQLRKFGAQQHRYKVKGHIISGR